MGWPEIAFQIGHQEKSCLVGCNSPSPKWVPGALRGDKQINAKCHFRMIKTQEVTSVPALTDTHGADGQKQAIQGNMHISLLHRRKASQPNMYFSAALSKKLWDGKHAGFLKDIIQQGCLHTVPGPGNTLTSPPHGRWGLAWLEVGGQGKLISFLRTPDKWQINLRGVLAQAFSSVIIKLKIMTYNTFEWNKMDWWPFVLFSLFKAPITKSFQSYENLTLNNKLAGANKDSLEVELLQGYMAIYSRHLLFLPALSSYPFDLTTASPFTSGQITPLPAHFWRARPYQLNQEVSTWLGWTNQKWPSWLVQRWPYDSGGSTLSKDLGTD